MKRLVLLLSLVLLLALAACGLQPETQEVLPGEGTAAAGETPGETTGEATPLPATPDVGDVIGGTIIPTLTGTTWEWVDTTTPVETIVAVDPARYTITFNEDGTANIMADCNSVTATYTADETGALTIMPGASTMMACPEDTQDQLFLGALASATNFFAIDTGNDLYIDQAADAGTMRFRVGGGTDVETESQLPTSLTGTTWEWVSVIDPMGQTAAADPTRYTITFNDDSTANIVADCNSATATYATDGSSLTIMPGATTLVACEPGSQDQLFLSSLNSAASYTVEDGELFIALDADAGTVMFRAAGTGAGATTEGGAAAAPVLTGTTWQWTDSMTASTATAVSDPTRYAITFNEDGTANITADCNSVLGTYMTAEDGSMTITLGPSTLVGCPEDSQATPFLAGLALVSDYSFDGETLRLTQAGGAEAFAFRPAAAEGETEAGAGEAAGMSLTGSVWQWVETVTPVETITAADPTRYTITFLEDGTAAIGADCNRVVATYTVADSALTIVPGPSTLAACPADSQATVFVTSLSSAAVYFFQDGHLFIDQFASAGTMKFAPAAVSEETGKGQTTAPAGSLVGPLWQLTEITKVDGNITINDPTRYTISFNADGTANLVTDCNVGGATYTTGDGNLLTITPGVSTMAFCGLGSFDQIFLGGLTNAMGYRIEDGNLLIDMLYESGTLVFVPAQQ